MVGYKIYHWRISFVKIISITELSASLSVYKYAFRLCVLTQEKVMMDAWWV